MGKRNDKKGAVAQQKDRINKGNHSMNPDRKVGAGGQNMRDRTTIKRLQMYRNFKPKRDSEGKITRPAIFQNILKPGATSRVAPNRKWFGNTRVITQKALQNFQDEMGKVMKDPYKVVMRATNLPISLLNETSKNARVHILDTEKFENTFGPKAHRKRPKIMAGDMESLLAQVNSANEKYSEEKDWDIVKDNEGVTGEAKHVIFRAGQSKRVWNELYKVVDSSDVVIQVLDCRDPIGTRSPHIEEYMRKEKPHKHLVFVLNKCDLVPTWVTQKWVAILSSEYPTMAFHSSLTNSFGKGAMINLLRQFGKLHSDKKQISVGFIGYPNVGKSSIINTLKQKKVCKTAPIAGETKVWQYITLMRRIFLIDCPGVVYPVGHSETDSILKGVVRVEYCKEPEDHIPAILAQVKEKYIAKTYKMESWTSHIDFLEQMARRCGKLLRGGEPDTSTVAKMVLNDWQRGKIPYFVRPPGSDDYVPKEYPVKGKDKSSKVSMPVENTDGADNQQMSTNALSSPGEYNAKRETDVGVQKVIQGQQIKVKQDFRKINVGNEFGEEDQKPLELDGLSESENEPESGDEEDNEEVVEEDDSNKETQQQKVKSKANVPKKMSQKPKTPKRQADFKIRTHSKKSKPTEKQSECKSSSGAFTVTGGASESDSIVPHSTHGFSEYTMEENKDTMCVNMNSHQPNQNPVIQRAQQKVKKQNRKRKFDDTDLDEGEQKITGKEKRRMYRQQKVTKVGEQYYQTANIKNRSNRKDT